MICDNCRAVYDTTDNFCRHCGSVLSVEVPVVRRSEPLPVPWEQVRPALTRGVAALAAGMVLDLLLRRISRGFPLPQRAVTRRLLRPFDGLRAQDERGANPPAARPQIEEYTEAIYVRRVRRGH